MDIVVEYVYAMRLLYSTAALFEKQDAVQGGNNISLKAKKQ